MNQTIDRCRQLYNAALEQRQVGWKLRRKSITYSLQQNELPALKKELPEFNGIQSQVLQDVLRRLDTAFQNFFEGREFDSTQVSRINIKLKPNGWYANLTCEVETVKPVITTTKQLGIDVGLNSFVATSAGELIENPRHLRKTEKYLKRLQR